MTLAARLSKVEEKAGRVIRCAWCRVSLVDDHQQQARGRTVTTDYVMRSCPFCGNEFRVPLEGLTARERESFVLWGYTHGGETYRDERAYAAQEWWNARAWVRILTSPPEEVRRRVAARKGPDKPDKYALERAALKAEAEELRKAEERRQRRLYGPRTFPLVATLRSLKAELKALDAPSYSPGFVRHTPAEKLARQILVHARRMAACEAVLWGEVEPKTAALIETREAEVAAFDAGREREAVKKREREEQYQRECEERERAHRGRAGEVVPSRQVSPRATTGTPEDWIRRLTTVDVGDTPIPHPIRPGATSFPDPADPSKEMIVGRDVGPEIYDPNHPDAVQSMRSPRPDPTPGFIVPEAEDEPARGSRYFRGEYYDGNPRY